MTNRVSKATSVSPSWRLDETLGHAEMAHVNAVLKRNGLRPMKAPFRVIDAFPLPMKLDTFARVTEEIIGELEREEPRA